MIGQIDLVEPEIPQILKLWQNRPNSIVHGDLFPRFDKFDLLARSCNGDLLEKGKIDLITPPPKSTVIELQNTRYSS